ncbi:MAG: tyrosine-type recombinase/integrase [Eubacterium sp.]|nr:tyrosine-type recombinase/integrase [Eubacterium sp.]
MKRTITQTHLDAFRQHLLDDEKSQITVDKYLRDVRSFAAYAAQGQDAAWDINKSLIMEYKSMLEKRYATTSANSMLASLNSFLRYMGWEDCCVRQFRVQKKAYSSAEKELTKAEYQRLIQTANQKGNERLSLLIQTICGTGIRVSELPYITVEALRQGEARVSCKGKLRIVFIVSKLRKKLLRYAKERRIESGSIFVTRTGKPMNRSNIWREMKNLCEQAGVSPDKVFPHNLRHLFARTFYGIEKDIAKLADILGHTSINTTRIYIMTTGAEHRKKLERMQLVT